MLEFAVSVKGLTEEGQAKWVLAVDPVGERLLVAHEDKSLHWHPMAACSFAKLLQPGSPRPVVVVQPQQPTLLTANRAERRRLEHDGA